MKFSIITPTLNRQSLIACCESINAQTFSGWQHVIAVDCADYDEELMAQIAHPQRVVFKCPHPHRNWANTCRHDAWEYATNDFLVHVDDDNVLSSSNILEKMSALLEAAGNPPFAIFPIFRHGSIFYNYPPAVCMTDTGNLVPRRDVGRWLDIPDATSDGILGEKLYKEYGCVGFEKSRPIIFMPESNVGRGVKAGEGMSDELMHE